MQTKKQLPTGIQTFAKLREGDCYYVDKTPLITELCKETAVFLSRPRRFGKSLTLSTIVALFSGQKELFTGLYAESHWDWSQTHPVIAISFGSGEFSSKAAKTAKALQQIKDNVYADKYRHSQQPIYLIGVEFSEQSRDIVHFAVEQDNQGELE